MDFSLRRIQSLLEVLPRYTRPTIHIAGTNGKGSVTAIIDSILRQAKFNTGRFNSPHLITVRDSISINGQCISSEAYAQARSAVELANTFDATSFELLTATALYAFETAKVDVVILEVGLGGRLDATNAIPDDVVIASGICSVDLDHQAILGDTVEQIAREKAGIARRGVPLLIGRQVHPSVHGTIEEVVEAAKGKLVRVESVVSVRYDDESSEPAEANLDLPQNSTPSPHGQAIVIRISGKELKTQLPLLGAHQLDNTALAVSIIETIRHQEPFNRIQLEHIASGISHVRWPGRLEWMSYTLPRSSRQITILADGAHNPASATALSSYLSSIPKLASALRNFVISLSHSPPKTPRAVLVPLLRSGDRVAVVQFSAVEGMPWVKPVAMEEMEEVSKTLVGDAARSFISLEDALEWAGEGEGPVIVSGSLYLIADLHLLRTGT